MSVYHKFGQLAPVVGVHLAKLETCEPQSRSRVRNRATPASGEHHQIERTLQDAGFGFPSIRHTNGISPLPLEGQLKSVSPRVIASDGCAQLPTGSYEITGSNRRAAEDRTDGEADVAHNRISP
jgi:hypothetical protein